MALRLGDWIENLESSWDYNTGSDHSSNLNIVFRLIQILTSGNFILLLGRVKALNERNDETKKERKVRKKEQGRSRQIRLRVYVNYRTF